MFVLLYRRSGQTVHALSGSAVKFKQKNLSEIVAQQVQKPISLYLTTLTET